MELIVLIVTAWIAYWIGFNFRDMKKLLLIPPTVFTLAMVLHRESKKDRKTVAIGNRGRVENASC